MNKETNKNAIRQSDDKIIIACDGACSGNGADSAVGGWGVAVKRGEEIIRISGFKASTTNNEMELTAMLEALKYANAVFSAAHSEKETTPRASIDIYSDSAYVVSCFEDKWYVGWERNGWINSQKQPVKNQELWRALLAEYRKMLGRGDSLNIRKIKGHISGGEADKWLEKYNKKYGLNMSAAEFSVALELNRIADDLATSEYANRQKKHIIEDGAVYNRDAKRGLYIIIPAGGSGQRFGAIKQFADIAGTPLLLLTIRNLIHSYNEYTKHQTAFPCEMRKIVVAMHPEHIPHADEVLAEFGGLVEITQGGASRAESVISAFLSINSAQAGNALTQSTATSTTEEKPQSTTKVTPKRAYNISENDILAVHDGCRPFITKELWSALLSGLENADFALPANPVTDTLKDKNTLKNYDRDRLIAVQTPQVMTMRAARKIYAVANSDLAALRAENITDDSTIAAHLGLSIRTVAGSSLNIKVTTQEDAALASAITKHFDKM